MAGRIRVGRRMMVTAICVLTICILTACGSPEAPRTEEQVTARAEAYAHAVNYDYKTPKEIYKYLTKEYREQMTEEQFTEAFEKERSFPYITPLYLMKPEQVVLSDDGMSAEVTYPQAARIIGMHYTVKLIYENGDYYVEDWKQFLDGSYLEKFDTVPYSLDWYYDTEETAK